MGLREDLKAASLASIERETITLPKTGLVVQIRGLMFEELSRIGKLKGWKSDTTMVALAVEDPATGELLWSPNALDDANEIGMLHGRDVRLIIDTINRLSGVDEEGNESGSESTGSTSPSDGLSVVA
jgi:hypothetical protein